MNLKKTIVTGVALSVILATSAFPVFAKDAAHAKLVHVGPNPACGTALIGPNKGEVEVQTSDKNNTFKVEVNVHGASPNTTYVVDIRCVKQIGSLKTNREGEGEAEIKLTTTPTSPFYIDISVPNGGGGVGGYGDTFISGPFTLN